MHVSDYYGDNFKWFVGVVKERSSDGMVRVRVFGIHRMDDVTDVSDGDLPWAIVILPATAGSSAASNADISLDTGDWVVGFFADGDNCQQPVVIGALGGNIYSNTDSAATDDTSFDGGNGGDGGGDGGGSDDGGDDGGAGDTDTTGINDTILVGNDNAEKSYIFLRAEWERRLGGDSERAHMLTCAIMGHLQAESSFRYKIDTNPNELAYGIVQWADKIDKKTRRFIPERRTALFRHFGYPAPGPKQRVSFKGPDLAQQLSYIFHELDTSETTAKKQLLAAKSLKQAVEAFSAYERHYGYDIVNQRVNHAKADGAPGHWLRRYNNALAFFNGYRKLNKKPEREIP